MKLCLVSPPTVTEFSKTIAESDAILRLAEHAPVGVLSLAAVLDELGRPPTIVDSNMLYYDYLRSTTADSANSAVSTVSADSGVAAHADFCSYAVNHLLTLDFDVIGLGTICSSYPLTLRVAEGVRAARPEATIVLGGPQASAVDLATLQHFPFIDCIVRYEAEQTLPQLLDAIEGDDDLARVNGITFRRGSEVIRTADAPVVADLDRLPLPAYHLYPYLRHARYIPLELGRGCPYGCTFCSTNDFFRRRFRLKRPALIVEQMSRLKQDYSIATFDLIHDMFTVDRRKVIEFCEALMASNETFHWNCSARTDRVDDELLDMMARAGCRGIFFGIETGSQKLQKTIHKKLVLTDAMARIRAASDCGMKVAASLITGFPDETLDDFRDTARFFTNTLRYENVEPQLHILAPLAGTPLHNQYQSELRFDDIVSDMSHQGWDQALADRESIAAYPDVFANFYAIPTMVPRPLLKEVRGFLLAASQQFPLLLVALQEEAGDVVEVVGDFQSWCEMPRDAPGHAQSDPHVDAQVDSPSNAQCDSRTHSHDNVPYFQTAGFKRDFLAFVRSRYVDGGAHAPALAALVAYFSSFDDVAVEDPSADLANVRKEMADGDGVLRRKAFRRESVPGLAKNVRCIDIDVDYRSLLECLVEGRGLDHVQRGRFRLASRKIAGQWPQVLQLSPMSASILNQVDGVKTVAEIGENLAKDSIHFADAPIDTACLVGLELLRHDGLVDEVAEVDVER